LGRGTSGFSAHAVLNFVDEIGNLDIALGERRHHDMTTVGNGERWESGSRAAIQIGMGSCTGLGTLVEVGNCQILPLCS
jgi:hypothetical protein